MIIVHLPEYIFFCFKVQNPLLGTHCTAEAHSITAFELTSNNFEFIHIGKSEIMLWCLHMIAMFFFVIPSLLLKGFHSQADLKMDEKSSLVSILPTRGAAKEDGRSKNCRNKLRISYPSRYKVDFVDEILESMNQDDDMTVTSVLNLRLRS